MIEKSEIRILMLDDEPFMLKLHNHMLTSFGFSQIKTCDSGRDALKWLDSQNSPPHIVLLDLNMPEMDGIEFVRHLVERRYTGSVILISGEDNRLQETAEKLVQAHKISILGHLHKPVNPKDLYALLEKWPPSCPDMPRTTKKVYSADELRMAIVNNQLVNYYHPKVEVSSGRVVGVESLLRWHHPQDKMVFPDQFIDVALAQGLIDDLTRFVTEKVFLQTKVWQDEGLKLQVAINISMENLLSLEFADNLAAAAFSAGIVPSNIVLEVNQTRLMEDSFSPLEILNRLRLKGFFLSIDDFGTGQSSLSQLRDIPFDELKIDRGFVHGAAGNERLRVIYNASLSLAKQLGMKTVAEGVEDQADWDFLRSTGCDLAQGYFIAKPMLAYEIPGWINDWEAKIENLFGSSGVC